MRMLALLALSTLMLAASPSLAAGTCADEKGFCPFRDAAGAAAPAGAGENCAEMAMADGKKAGCCGSKAAKAGDAVGCCSGEKAAAAGGCDGASCGEETPDGGAAPHAHPGA